MRALVVPFALASSLAFFTAAASCSSSNGGSSSSGTDAETYPPNQPLGAPCDPSLANACAPGGNACEVVVCAASSGTCIDTETDAPCASDAATVDDTTSAPCGSSGDCAAGETCAFLVTLACSAQGECVVPAPPKASDGGPVVACGCDGTAATYVTRLATNAPVESEGPCADASAITPSDAAPE